MAAGIATKTTITTTKKTMHHQDHAEQQKMPTYVRRATTKKGMPSHTAIPMEQVGISPTLVAVANIQESYIRKWLRCPTRWEAVAMSIRKQQPEMTAVVNV